MSRDRIYKNWIVGRLHENPFVAVIGLLAAIITVVTFLLPADCTVEPPRRKRFLVIDNITESKREPVWGNESYGDDEITVEIKGSCTALGTKLNDFKLVVFWRLASGFETNWHIGGRRVGGNYKLATLDGESAVAGNWDFLVGAIEAEKTYSGSIAVRLLAFPNDVVTNNQREWLKKSRGWGFEDLPTDGRLAMSVPRAFTTTANR